MHCINSVSLKAFTKAGKWNKHLNEKLIIQYICNLHCSVPNFVLAPYQLHVFEFGLHYEKVAHYTK
jgi:hypothetical protein